MDVYDTLLTQAEIQGNISQVNDTTFKPLHGKFKDKFIRDHVQCTKIFINVFAWLYE